MAIALAAGLAALAALLFALRGAPLGVPVADDYSFLARLRFQHPLDPFDSMGATYYWRPLARQIYFSLIGAGAFAAPWVAATVHLALLVATFAALFMLLRRAFAPWTAATIAVFPLLAEPVRALVTWPSGIQHLLAAALTAVAIAAAAGGRLLPAAVAAFAGVLSHESAWIGVAALPIAAWLRDRDPRRARPWLFAAILIAAAWGVGYRVALAHGVALPPGLSQAFSLPRVARLAGLAVRAAWNLDDLGPTTAIALLAGHAALALAAFARFLQPVPRARLARLRLPLALGLVAFLAGALPLAALLPDWNAWRAWMPALALGVTWGALLACASSWLAAGFVLLRLVALLLAPPAPSTVEKEPPATASHMSFERLVRLQRTVESARRVMLADHPSLPRGATLLFWEIPRLAEVAFQEQTAARTWYGDSTLVWRSFGGFEGFRRRSSALIEFVTGERDPAQVVDPVSFAHYARGVEAMQKQNPLAADAELDSALATGNPRHGPLHWVVLNNRARVAASLGDFARADSINNLCLAGAPDPSSWALAAKIALARGDRARALAAARQAMLYDTGNAEAREVMRLLGEE